MIPIFPTPVPPESGHGKADYLRVAPRTEEERLAARKAARLSLDTSAHGEGGGWCPTALLSVGLLAADVMV